MDSSKRKISDFADVCEVWLSELYIGSAPEKVAVWESEGWSSDKAEWTGTWHGLLAAGGLFSCALAAPSQNFGYCAPKSSDVTFLTMHSARIFTKWPTTLLLRLRQQPVLRHPMATPIQVILSQRTLATRAIQADAAAETETAAEAEAVGGVVIRREVTAPRVRDRRRAGARRAAPNGRKLQPIGKMLEDTN